MTQPSPPHPKFDPRCLRLLALLKNQDLPACRAVLQRTLTQRSPEWLYLHVLIPVVYLAGEKFHANQLNGLPFDTVLAQVRDLLAIPQAHLARQPRLHKSIFLTYLPNDIHSLALLAIRDWLDRDGWDVTLPYPPPPLPNLADQILSLRPSAIGLSCTLPRSVADARRLIRSLRQHPPTPPIWIGGPAINTVPTLFEKSEAPHTAHDIIAFTQQLAAEFHYLSATPTTGLTLSGA